MGEGQFGGQCNITDTRPPSRRIGLRRGGLSQYLDVYDLADESGFAGLCGRLRGIGNVDFLVRRPVFWWPQREVGQPTSKFLSVAKTQSHLAPWRPYGLKPFLCEKSIHRCPSLLIAVSRSAPTSPCPRRRQSRLWLCLGVHPRLLRTQFRVLETTWNRWLHQRPRPPW